MFRAGSDEAFTAIHDRYRQRLFAYVRQMLAGRSRQDAEDVLQDVFVRAYSALRADARDVNLRAWLYRVAHNRCIDQVRRPHLPEREVFEMSRTPLVDPVEKAQRRDDLRRLVGDVGRLPDQQRSALLMREIDGMAYADIADALNVTVPAVKSLLVRARIGLAEAAEARETACTVIREDLTASYDRGVKASAKARRHMRECSGCREFRDSLRGLRRSFAAISPLGAMGPLALAAKALGIGSAGGGGGTAAGGSAAVAGGTFAAGATAGKVAAVVCTAAITAGAAVEVERTVGERPAAPAPASRAAQQRPAAVSTGHVLRAAPALGTRAAGPSRAQRRRARAERTRGAAAPAAAVPAAPATPETEAAVTTGGVLAPDDETVTPSPSADPPAAAPEVVPDTLRPQSGGASEAPGQTPSSVDPRTAGGTPPSDPGAPPDEH